VSRYSHRDKYTFEDSAVVSDLRYWGLWKGIQCAADGYSPESTIRELLSGRTEISGHRILCKEMPDRAWEIDVRVRQIPLPFRAALFVRYCLQMKENADKSMRPYNEHELARFLDVSVRMYRALLVSAKNRYKTMLFGPPLNLLKAACG
jgi:hypothetical protein